MKGAAAILFACLLAGCGSSPAPEQKSESKPPAEAPAPKNDSRMLLPENMVDAVVTKNHVLDNDVLPGGTVGDYAEGGKKYQMFIIETDSAQDAAILLLDFKKTLADPTYIAYMGGYFGLTNSGTDKGKPVYVFAKQQYLAGIAGLGRDAADILARKLAVNLR